MAVPAVRVRLGPALLILLFAASAAQAWITINDKCSLFKCLRGPKLDTFKDDKSDKNRGTWSHWFGPQTTVTKYCAEGGLDKGGMIEMKLKAGAVRLVDLNDPCEVAELVEAVHDNAKQAQQQALKQSGANANAGKPDSKQKPLQQMTQKKPSLLDKLKQQEIAISKTSTSDVDAVDCFGYKPTKKLLDHKEKLQHFFSVKKSDCKDLTFVRGTVEKIDNAFGGEFCTWLSGFAPPKYQDVGGFFVRKTSKTLQLFPDLDIKNQGTFDMSEYFVCDRSADAFDIALDTANFKKYESKSKDCCDNC